METQQSKKIIQSYLISHLPNGIISITQNKRDNRKIYIGLILFLILGLLSFLADYLDYWNDGRYIGILFSILALIALLALFSKYKLEIDKVNKRIILMNKVHDNIKQIKVKIHQVDRDTLGALEKWNMPVIYAVKEDGKEIELLPLDVFLKSDENAVRKTNEAITQFQELFKDNWPVEIVV